jgi:small subunit ribosomal protein S1
VGLPGEMDGLIHLSDLDWNSNSEDIISKYKKGDLVKAKLLEIDIEKERVSLGIKQLSEDPMANNKDLIKGNIVTSIIKNITEKGLHVKINEGISGFVKKLELAKERTDQRVDRFAVGEKIDARIMSIDFSTREVALSIKALQVAEEKQALKDYGSVDSGASLGDILGAALEKKAKKKVVIEKPKAKKATKTKAKIKAKAKTKTKIKAKTKTTTSKTKKAEPKK